MTALRPMVGIFFRSLCDDYWSEAIVRKQIVWNARAVSVFAGMTERLMRAPFFYFQH